MKKTKLLLKKWKNLEKSDKVYYLVIVGFVLSAIVALFIGLSIYGWSIIDLLKDTRTIFIGFIALIICIGATFTVGTHNAQHGITKQKARIFKILVALTITFALCSIALIIINWEVWTSGK